MNIKYKQWWSTFSAIAIYVLIAIILRNRCLTFVQQLKTNKYNFISTCGLFNLTQKEKQIWKTIHFVFNLWCLIFSFDVLQHSERQNNLQKMRKKYCKRHYLKFTQVVRWQNKEAYHTVGKVPKSNRQIIARGNIDTSTT